MRRHRNGDGELSAEEPPNLSVTGRSPTVDTMLLSPFFLFEHEVDGRTGKYWYNIREKY
jgi:hypothetical protein